MNRTKGLTDKVGFVFCSALVVALTGCTSYQDQPRYRDAYFRPSPQVESSYYVGIRTESDFYEPLSPYGRWEVIGSYGRCWVPSRVDRDWRPYSNGYWQRTDAGWYWASDEPWAWAAYHYGRWDSSPQYGWYWVPQTQWAPAWVSWRQGGGYVGWAPLRPSARFGGRDVTPRGYVFVQERQFLEPVRPTTVIVNNTVINNTVNITKTHVVNKTVINEGPSTAVIEQTSGRKLQAIPVRELRRRQEAEVVAEIRNAPPGYEKKAQTPVRTEAEPRDSNAVPAHEARQVERPAVTTTAPEAPATKKVAHETEVEKRATQSTRPQEDNRASQEKKYGTDSAKGKPVPSSGEAKLGARHEGEQPVAAREATESKTQEHAHKQAEKHADKSEKKAQQVLEHHVKKDQPATEQDGTNTVNKVHEKKGEE
jgi:hypothetical protein